MGNFRLPPGADSFSPAEINLTDGYVSKLETSETDPRVVFDSSGLWATDPSGGLVFQLDAATGKGFFKGLLRSQGIVIPSQPFAASVPLNNIDWTSDGTLTGALVARMSVVNENAQIKLESRGALDPLLNLHVGEISLLASSGGAADTGIVPSAKLDLYAQNSVHADTARAKIIIASGENPDREALILDDTGSSDFVFATDPRMTDSRTPTAHKSTHAAGGSDALSPGDINAVPTTDPRLTNARTPTAHKSTHAIGGSDALSPADIGALSLLATGTNRKLAFGTATATFPGGSPSATDVTITHGLGASPLMVIANAILVFEASCVCEVLTVGATSFKIRVTTVNASSPAAGVNKAFFWAAIA